MVITRCLPRGRERKTFLTVSGGNGLENDLAESWTSPIRKKLAGGGEQISKAIHAPAAKLIGTDVGRQKGKGEGVDCSYANSS